jgi:hypothetical protein
LGLDLPPVRGRHACTARHVVAARAVGALSILGKAVKPTVMDQSFVLCPHCQQHRAQVWSDGRGGRMCRCPDCGPVTVEAADGAALVLDEDWLRQKMRLALGIESRDGIDDLGGGAWRLGDARRSPVLLARDLTRVLHEPALLERVRVAGGDIRVITPRPSTTRGAPFGAGVEWLALEERFAFYGGGITFIATPSSVAQAVADPATPVNGPFSADFRWATLPDVQATPIQFTKGQAKRVQSALGTFKGVEVDGERDHAARRPEERQAHRPVQDQSERQGQSSACGTACGLRRTRGHAATRGAICDAVCGSEKGGCHDVSTPPDAPRLARFQEPDLFNFWSI